MKWLPGTRSYHAELGVVAESLLRGSASGLVGAYFELGCEALRIWYPKDLSSDLIQAEGR